MSTLAEFTDTVIAGVIAGLPLQDSATTTVLVEDYITTAGGWVPDDVGFPVGEGELANGEDEDEAIASIIEIEYSKMYESTLSITVTFDLKRVSYLTPGLNQASIRAAIDGVARNALTDALEEAGFDPVSSSLISSTSEEGGVFDAPRRVALEAESPTESFSALVLDEVRTSQGLNNTWSVSSLYSKSTGLIAYIIMKYTNTSYNVLDSGVTYCYVVKADPLTKRTVSTLRLEM